VRKLEINYPSDYFRSVISKELNGNTENKYPVHSTPIEPKRIEKHFMKCEFPFFLVINPNGHKCFISECPNTARKEAWRLNNGK
jgi:hypothetical protein